VTPQSGGGSSDTLVATAQQLITGGGDGQIRIAPLGASKPPRAVPGHVGPINAVAATADGKVLVTAGVDATIRFWAMSSMTPLAALELFPDSDWLAYTPRGGFDGTRAAWTKATFHFRSDPLRAYAPEQFFSVFFQPGILQDVMIKGTVASNAPDATHSAEAVRHSKIPGVRILSPRDTTEFETGLPAEGVWTQPSTGRTIPAVMPSALRSVRLTRPSIKEETMTLEAEIRDGGSGVRDCRVFQNQSLVRRFDGPFQVDARTRLGTLRVPLEVLPGSNELSVYCFNDANVRSPIASIAVTGATALKRSRRAFVIAAGGNGYGHGLRRLRYAEADAQLTLETLKSSLDHTGDYASIVTVPLVGAKATAGNILAALRLLSGQPAETNPLPAELGPLATARLEDTVIVFFAGHGAAHGDRYTLYPVDAEITPRVTHTIDDRQLESALRSVNAGHLLLILDTCQSGQILQTAGDDRRGPLNTRGFAQLAYEKRLQVLAASQSYESAFEDRHLQHGLLTYALMENGLRQRNADDAPSDGTIESEEWLRYVVRRVPELHGQTARAEVIFDDESAPRVQQPQIYLPPGGSGLVIARNP